MSPTVGTLRELFAARGSSQYGGEAVTQLEHALQSGALAMADDADDALVAASLLHDVGHLLHDLPADSPDSGVDDHHENSAARLLAEAFGPAVSEPVRLHVAAKRYMTGIDPAYMGALSGPSMTSLMLQGGPMTAAEQEVFRAEPHWEAAVRLRRYDDGAKVAHAATPSFADFEPLLARLAARHEERRA